MKFTPPVLKAAALILLAAGALVAGPLSPPAGPLTPTYKTLAEIQPAIPVQSLAGSQFALHVITQPGSYYLTGPLTAVANTNGIQVLADDVTLDLSGFEINGGGLGADGIHAGDANAPVRGLTVRNGSIVNWNRGGIRADTASGCLFEDLHFRSAGQIGLRSGPGVVRACTFVGGQTGAFLDGGEIVDCSATGCTYGGFLLEEGSSAHRCAAYECFTGFFMGANNSLIDCVCRGGNLGINVYSNANLVRGCKIGPVPQGIMCEWGSTIVGNTFNAAVAGEGYGMLVHYGGNHIEGNHLYAFNQGIALYSSSTTNVVISNTMHACPIPLNPLNGFGHPMCAPAVSTAAALAANPVANIAQ